jgi:AraC family transcriptional regulator
VAGAAAGEVAPAAMKKKRPERPATDAERAFLAPAKEFLEREALRSPSFREAAAIVRLSHYHFHRRFTLAFGVTPGRLVADLQVATVKKLLLDGATCGDIWARCGFAHRSHMGSRFKQLVGASPGRWLRAERERAAAAAASTTAAA